MKTRIISKLNPLRNNKYDGRKRLYYPQYKKLFRWNYFKVDDNTDENFSSLKDAKKYIDEVKNIEIFNY